MSYQNTPNLAVSGPISHPFAGTWSSRNLQRNLYYYSYYWLSDWIGLIVNSTEIFLIILFYGIQQSNLGSYHNGMRVPTNSG